MILKIGRNSNERIVPQISPEYIWEYIDKVTNAYAHNYEPPTLDQSIMVSTDVTYLTEADRWEVVGGKAHLTTLSGEDVCYLMNDSGKTIERLR